MTWNVGGTERTIRMYLGVILLAVAFFVELPMWGAGVASVVGVVAFVTGAAGFCPAWLLFGINTCSTKPVAKT